MKTFCISFWKEAFHPEKMKSICFKLDKEADRGFGSLAWASQQAGA